MFNKKEESMECEFFAVDPYIVDLVNIINQAELDKG